MSKTRSLLGWAWLAALTAGALQGCNSDDSDPSDPAGESGASGEAGSAISSSGKGGGGTGGAGNPSAGTAGSTTQTPLGGAGGEPAETPDPVGGEAGQPNPPDTAPFFPGWLDPPADAKELVEGADTKEEVTSGVKLYQCARRTYDVTKQFDRVLGLSAQFVDIKPGALIEGKPAQQGQFAIIPGARSPLTLSIDLPLTNPVRVIEKPNSATIQAAIASLQLAADDELDATELRSNFTHSLESVQSFEDASLYFGVDLNYSGPLASAGLNTTFETNRTAGTQYWAVKHIEEMYTITFADDEFTTLQDFFGADQGEAQLHKLEEQGLIGEDNPPLFVKSVTYGRIVLATSEAHQVYNTKDFNLLLEAAGFGFSGDVELTEEYKQLAESSSFQLLVLGGNADEALNALHNAKIEDMFGPATAKTAQPLYYSLRFAQGERRSAKVGSTTTYTEETCGQCVTCPEDWWLDQECRLDRHDAGSAEVWDQDYAMHTSGGFTVPSGAGIHEARVCVDAGWLSGGITNNGEHGFDVYCGSYRQSVARNEVTGDGFAHHKQWCWDALAPGTSCGADNFGPTWTPWAQGLGHAKIQFTVDYYSGAPTCSED